ncbi:MAG: GTP cyclohydrolase I FolE2 [Deltaproteobacteria bacterium]|nr:GTP cyclohydrolase I FolE2 [Deltaproteobacteria bacterium]
MANLTGVLHEHENARPGLSPEIPLSGHQRALREGKDVPEQAPSFQIVLTEVGISEKTIWISLPQGKLPFNTVISVNLPEHLRGIHMSRIEEAVSQLYQKSFSDIRYYAQELAPLVLERQRGEWARVVVSGKAPLVRRTSVSQRTSVDAVDISAEVCASLNGTTMSFKTIIGLGLCHITACPCTQVYNQVLSQTVDADFPILTHSQRAETKLFLEVHGDHPTYEEILECLESTLHVTQDLLKRPDEAEIVLKAHRFPQFVEDVAREVAKEVGKRFDGKLPDATEVIVESLSFESIHTHNVRCILKTTLKEILDAIYKQARLDAEKRN